MHNLTAEQQAEHEKKSAALASVVAAVVLTLIKITVGISTNSLGILSEAAHSGLDLVAAAVTYGAVRYASSPADKEHPFGHGKMENLSALVETVLLLVTCVWILWEAIDRLFFTPAVVNPSLWAFGVMAISIIVDVSRSRMLLRVAKKHRSQALEADALHFSTDIWSSAVVIVGLVGLYAAQVLPEGSTLRPWLERADALAAIGVSFIIIHVSIELGRKAIDVLLDAGDSKIAAAIQEAVAHHPSIKTITQLRVRHSGPLVFVELAAAIDSALSMVQAQLIQKEIEDTIKIVEPHAEPTVQLVANAPQQEDTIAHIRAIAAAMDLPVHAVEVFDVSQIQEAVSKTLVQLHIEMPPTLLLADAYKKVWLFEQKLRNTYPEMQLMTHIEPYADVSEEQTAAISQKRTAAIHKTVSQLISEEPDVAEEHKVLVYRYGDGEAVSFHCCVRGSLTVATSHDIASRLQAKLHKARPEIKHVIVHIEPLPPTPFPEHT